MTQYLVSVIHGELSYSDDEIATIMAAVDAFNLKYADQIVFAGGLEPPASATMVDGTGSSVTVTDGPFSEAKEQVGGFWVFEAPDLDAALKIAAEGSAACALAVEVRPFQSGPPEA